MNVLIFGGTGLLGSAAAQIFIDRGHHVKTIALPPLPEGAPIPKEMEIEFGNFLELSDEQLEAAMTGMDAFVYAAGVDERVEFPAPVYDAYKKYNIDPVDRCLAMAKKCGVKRCVVLGSYFSWLAKTHPEMDLCAKHPYIRSRIDQEKVAAKYADENMGVGVLELPYIFGTQPGRRPVWAPDGDERSLRGGSGKSKAGESGSESGFYAYLWGLPVAVFVKYCCNGIRKETYRIYQRRDRRGLAAASLHPFGRLRPHASRSLQPAGAAVGEAGKRRDRPDRRAGRKMPFGSALLS